MSHFNYIVYTVKVFLISDKLFVGKSRSS